jgi:cell wall-associated NlpC family hydrolase
MTLSPNSLRLPVLRPLAAFAVVAACAAPARAQGPSQPVDAHPAVADLPGISTTEAARQLAANAMRVAAASAPAPAVSRSTKPFAAWSASAHAFRDSILVSIARTALGTPYVHGGESFDGGFDCSGLVRYVMTALHVPVPRTAAEQAGVGVALGRDTTRLRPGDLLTFGKGKRGVSHVGIYVGNGRYVHASSVAGRVIESDIQRPPSPLVKVWRGTRRILSDASADSTAKGDS